MGETGTSSVNLRKLESRLRRRLQREDPSTAPLQVSCLLREEDLFILLHYPETSLPSPPAIFPLLRQILEAEDTCRPYRIQLYLIVCGPLERLGSVLSGSGESASAEELPALEAELNLEPGQWIFIKDPELPDGRRSGRLRKTWDRATAQKLPAVAAAMGVVLASLYGLTRPCVLGRCEAIPQARQLAREAFNTFHSLPSETAFFSARQKFEAAIERLQPIPSWSKQGAESAKLLKEYQFHSDSLATLLQAVELGKKASLASQNPPLPAAEWQEIKTLWQEAVSSLQGISPDSPFSLSAQLKRQEYQRNLTNIERRLQAEEQASASLKKGEEAAKIAKIRQDSAESLSDWQLVQATWQTALERLREIPAGTSAYESAQKLLADYRPQWISSTTRKKQEEVAHSLYQKAVDRAKMAEKSTAQKQWPKAVSQWREALAYLQQVSRSTFQYSKAQPLISSYTLAAKQAEGQVKAERQQKQYQNDLQNLCSDSMKICTYKLTESAIQVRLTSDYMQRLWNAALQAKAQENLQKKVELLDHLSKFEQKLQAMADKTKKRLEVYNTDGSLTAAYTPRVPVQ